jgi:hypothetical protein
MSKNEINVYWTPNIHPESLYKDFYLSPEKVTSLRSKEMNKDRVPNMGSAGFFSCPAFKDLFKNVYSFTSGFDDSIKIDEWVIDTEKKIVGRESLPIKSKIVINRVRPSSLVNQTNLTLGLSWLFFAEEPVIGRFTAPYFPPTSPGEEATLSCGQFDIGSWFRQFDLDYHITKNTKSLNFKKNEDLFYLEIMTNKKINLQKFNMTKEILILQNEYVKLNQVELKNKTLKDRYSFANKEINKKVLKEIKKNLII